MVSNLEIINKKLSSFSTKYFLNKAISGFIVFIVFSVAISVLFLFIEYFLFLDIKIKFFGITLFLFLISFSFIYLVLVPLLRSFNVFKGLSTIKINEIIVKALPDIKDKLINVLELSENRSEDVYSEELVIASIDQKISELKYFDFNSAIQFKDYFKFFYYLIGVLFFSLTIYFIKPSFFSDTSYRIINYKMKFEKPLPYTLSILNDNLSVGKGEDFVLSVLVDGLEADQPVNLLLSGKLFLMKNDSLNYYSYKFNNVNNDLFFQFSLNNYKTVIYKLDVLQKPLLNNFTAQLNKPDYTSLKDEEISNVTEITVPIGTNIHFVFSAYNTDSLFVLIDSSSYSVDKISKNEFVLDKKIMKDQSLSIDLKNANFYLPNYLKINISTIVDNYPTISLKSFTDSVEFTKVYFRGKIDDDYGFSKLLFNVKINDVTDSSYSLNILKNISSQEFFYAYDFSFYKLINKSISYYFEVFDNDIVTGPKSSLSEVFVFNFPTTEDIYSHQDEAFNDLESIIENSYNLADKLKNDLSEMKKKMLDSNLSEYERKEIQKQINTTSNNLEKQIEMLKDKNAELNNYMKSFTEQDKSILDKQNQIQELLDDVFSDELKKLLDEFNKMMQEFNKDNLNKSKEKLDISLDDLSKQLDRNLEMLKRMKLEQTLDMLSKNMQEAVKKQQESLDGIENKFDKDNLSTKQNELKNDLENIQKQYNDLQKINNELSQPMNMFDFDNEFKEIQSEFSKSIDDINKGNKKKSKESLQKNSENLKNLQFNMNQMIENMFKQQNMENLADLIQILDNLVTYSFNQEALIKNTSRNNFNTIVFSEQKKLYNDFSIIKDSLYSLAKREPSIDKHINKELVSIQNNFLSINDAFESNLIQNISVNQQKVLTSVNNLSLFMDEIIKKLQEQEANSNPSNQNCNKPGNKPNPKSMNSSMQQMQQSLQQQLQKIMQMMKDGKQGKDIQGEMGKAISQQEAMHDMLQKLMNQGNVGSSAYETLKEADQLLDKVREDILRNNISNNTLNRQKQIMTRLLEAEKSENERDFEEERKSNTAKDQFSSKTNYNIPEKAFEINYEEKLLKNKLILNSFYQNKFQKYVTTLDSINGK